MTILLQDIWRIKDLADYKIHFARYNQQSQPLEVWLRSKEEWQGWQETRPKKDDFNRPFIFSLIHFHYETDIWLFGGVFRVLERHADRYEVELTDFGKEFIGRLKIRSSYRNRQTRTNMTPYYHELEVQEILREPYSGAAFCGYDKINLSFKELEVLIGNDRPDWKTALENIKGIYLITDTHTNKRYVGMAHGEEGIWSRWKDYIATGDGGNKGMIDLINQYGSEYCCKYFHFTLLEHHFSKTPDEKIFEREGYWKCVLDSRGVDGLNRN